MFYVGYCLVYIVHVYTYFLLIMLLLNVSNSYQRCLPIYEHQNKNNNLSSKNRANCSINKADELCTHVSDGVTCAECVSVAPSESNGQLRAVASQSDDKIRQQTAGGRN